jgi:hypothetical protein
MNDQTKLALFDTLLAYLIQSSTAMDGTIKALATGALVSPLVLNDAIDSAKVLMSKVIHLSLMLDCFSCVLADKMRGVYSRHHRNSINEPATIHDLPFEVLKEAFLFLVKDFGSDLAPPSLVCRAFRAVALELMSSRMRFVNEKELIDGFICGRQLRSIVGLESCAIKHLVIDLEFIRKELIPLIDRLVSPTLSSLCFEVSVEDSFSECYEAMGIYFNQCDGISALRLEEFDFGDNPVAIPQI